MRLTELLEQALNRPPEMQDSLETLSAVINTSHLLLKYIADTMEAGESLDSALPAIKREIDKLDRYAGAATTKRGKQVVAAILEVIEEEKEESEKAH